MTWLGEKVREAVRTDRENHERFVAALMGVLAALAVAALVVSCLSGCDFTGLQKSVEEIRVAAQETSVNTGALADTITDTTIQSDRKGKLSRIEPVSESGSFPFTEIFGGLISTLLFVLTGVQVKKYGWQKQGAKGAKE